MIDGLNISLTCQGLEISVHWIIIILAVVFLTSLFFKKDFFKRLKKFELQEAKIGFWGGSAELTFNLDESDIRMAYKIWVEMSTRKVGHPIDFEDDNLIEVYNSWYSCFSVTRDLIKDVSVSKLDNDESKKFVRFSIEILNKGLRPHLTKWQSRFRSWHKNNEDSFADLSPQEIQKKFPQYDELRKDLETTNEGLIYYREQLETFLFE